MNRSKGVTPHLSFSPAWRAPREKEYVFSVLTPSMMERYEGLKLLQSVV